MEPVSLMSMASIGNTVCISRLTIPVDFRLIVFRPFKGEIILGQISSSSEYGMRSMMPIFLNHLKPRLMSAVRLDFFDDIYVLPHLMFIPSHL